MIRTPRSAEEIDKSCSVLRAQSGHLIFFDGRRHPHYVRPLAAASSLRVVAVMNYYTPSCPESTRPPELNRHLFGDGWCSAARALSRLPARQTGQARC